VSVRYTPSDIVYFVNHLVPPAHLRGRTSLCWEAIQGGVFFVLIDRFQRTKPHGGVSGRRTT
jgi:hypothetical protein